MRVAIGTCVALSVLGLCPAATAQTLTFQQAIDQARSRAPEILASVARIDEARARLLGASLRFRENPTLDLDVGPRTGAGRSSLDYSAAVGQAFEPPGRRRARIASATATVDGESASADEVSRILVRDVAIAYVRAVGAGERVRLLAEVEAAAAQLSAATDRRYQAGDVAALDVNLTRIAAARARADRLRAEAELGDAGRPLRTALGLAADTPLALERVLDRAPAPRAVLVAAIERAPAVRRAEADVAAAQAEQALGAALRRPGLAGRLSLSREQDDHIVVGGLSLTLPVFDSGQSVRAEADARLRRATQEREAAVRALEVNVLAGLATYTQRQAAADALRDAALPAATDNEQLAARSLEAGQLNLMELLLVRQDATAARLAYVDALTEAAVAAIEVDAAAGVLR
jgi:cobalt-zinc-cadmium efflux system outer membrane protein